MGLSGDIDRQVYRELKDILQRYPIITAVTYEPDSIIKTSIRATIDSDRVSPPTGPQSPTLDVEWRFDKEGQQYRIHYADPNTGLSCGWHRDDDHPDLGPVHFQYSLADSEGTHHKPAEIEANVPSEILWETLDTLFSETLPELTSSQNR